MTRGSRGNLLWSCLLAVLLSTPAAAQHDGKPRGRALTAFVHLDHASLGKQVDAALTVLRQLSAEFSKAGYDVESLRIVTQPIGELVRGLSDEQALAYIQELDDLSAR